jgi:octaprenyl-diphosphate synthase
MSLATICLPVQSELKEVEDVLIRHATSDVGLVTEAAKYVLQNGGKRIRPALLLLTAKLLGFPIAKAIDLGAAVEMIHAASLMHDDVLDDAEIRRGKPSSNVKWGNQISILVGDFLWCRSSEIAISYGNDRILSSITAAVKNTTEGEILEIVRSSDFDINEEDYLRIIELKTAMLFACSCQLGAILAGASKNFEETMKTYGLNIGIAFQLADDVLDYVSNDVNLGKKTGTDLCEGKLTLPIILALKKCRENDGKILKDALLANTLDAAKLKEIRTILESLGTLQESMNIAKKYVKAAKDALIPFKPSLERDALAAIADYAVSRDK